MYPLSIGTGASAPEKSPDQLPSRHILLPCSNIISYIFPNVKYLIYMNEIFKKFGINISPATGKDIENFYINQGAGWKQLGWKPLTDYKNYIVSKQDDQIGILTKYKKKQWGFHNKFSGVSGAFPNMEEAILELLRTTDMAKPLYIDSKLSGNVITRIFDITLLSNDLTNPNEELLLMGYVTFTTPGYRKKYQIVKDKNSTRLMFIDLPNKQIFTPNGKEFQAINKITFLGTLGEQIAEKIHHPIIQSS